MLHGKNKGVLSCEPFIVTSSYNILLCISNYLLGPKSLLAIENRIRSLHDLLLISDNDCRIKSVRLLVK